MVKTKKDLVVEVLIKNTDGLTIQEISQVLKISRNTVAIALAELKGEESIRIRVIGKAKLIYWAGEKK
jgi:DNA-binding transcriptional regulator LsrR (DeoR family)